MLEDLDGSIKPGGVYFLFPRDQYPAGISDILIPAENDLAHFAVFSGGDQTS